MRPGIGGSFSTKGPGYGGPEKASSLCADVEGSLKIPFYKGSIRFPLRIPLRLGLESGFVTRLGLKD